MPEPDPDLLERLIRIVGWMRRTQRVQVAGAEAVPPGPCLIVANHTGWSGLDYALLAHVLHRDLGRPVRAAVHAGYFDMPGVRDLAAKLGFFEASVVAAVRELDAGNTVVIFPEGEEGNFKPIWRLYQLQRFQAGFARIGLAALRPVLPVTIIGGEEASPVLGQVRIANRYLVPIPLSLLPLPVRWRIGFHEPVDPAPFLKEDRADGDPVEALRAHVEALMRRHVADDLEARGHPFLGP